MTTYCPHCNREVDADDLVESPINMPEGCVCNPKEWCDPTNIPPICPQFSPMDAPDERLCRGCEHEEPCHAKAEGR